MIFPAPAPAAAATRSRSWQMRREGRLPPEVTPPFLNIGSGGSYADDDAPPRRPKHYQPAVGPGLLNRFFALCWVPLLLWTPNGCGSVPLASVGLLVFLGGIGAWNLADNVAALRPSVDQINLSFPPDHMFYGLRTHLAQDFLVGGTATDFSETKVYIGVAGFDREAVGFSGLRPTIEPRGVI